MYLHCNLVVCNASKPSSRCSVDCSSLDFPRRRRETADEKGLKRAGLTEGPFIFNREPESAARDDFREKGTSMSNCTLFDATIGVQAGEGRKRCLHIQLSGFLL